MSTGRSSKPQYDMERATGIQSWCLRGIAAHGLMKRSWESRTDLAYLILSRETLFGYAQLQHPISASHSIPAGTDLIHFDGRGAPVGMILSAPEALCQARGITIWPVMIL